MKKRIKLTQIIGLYMVATNETAITYDKLQDYIGFIQTSFERNKEDATVVYSSEELKDLRYGTDYYFTANQLGIESKVSVNELNRSVVSFMDTDTIIATYNLTEEFLNKQKDKTKSNRNKKVGKSL